jgi:hypothetical protein
VLPAAQARCDFCLSIPVVRLFTSNSFILDEAHPEVGLGALLSDGGWAACAVCAALVDADNWKGVTDRALSAFIGRHPELDCAAGREKAREVLSSTYVRLRAEMRAAVRAITSPAEHMIQ